jgi:hypothetical protein
MKVRTFTAIAGLFFVLGLIAGPVHSLGGAVASDFYKLGLYLCSATVFWLWLRADAARRNVPRSWTVLVGVGWLAASVLVASAYLIWTRGLRQGFVAAASMLLVIVLLFLALAAGAVASVEMANALHL